MSKPAEFHVVFEISGEVLEACLESDSYARTILKQELDDTLEDFMSQLADLRIEAEAEETTEAGSN